MIAYDLQIEAVCSSLVYEHNTGPTTRRYQPWDADRQSCLVILTTKGADKSAMRSFDLLGKWSSYTGNHTLIHHHRRDKDKGGGELGILP